MSILNIQGSKTLSAKDCIEMDPVVISVRSTSDGCCLFCLCGSEDGSLQSNARCSCKYMYHAPCFVRYMRSQECPLCKVSYVPVGAPTILVIPTHLLPGATTVAAVAAVPANDGLRFYHIMCCIFILCVIVTGVGGAVVAAG